MMFLVISQGYGSFEVKLEAQDTRGGIEKTYGAIAYDPSTLQILDNGTSRPRALSMNDHTDH